MHKEIAAERNSQREVALENKEIAAVHKEIAAERNSQRRVALENKEIAAVHKEKAAERMGGAANYKERVPIEGDL